MLFGLAGASPASGYIYWSGGCPGSGGPIGRADLSGHGVKQQLIIHASCASVAVQGAYLYWTDYDAIIGRANIDGSGVAREFIKLPGTAPDIGIGAVAADSKYVYWSEWHDNHSTIGRANLDGTGIDEDYIKGVATAGSLAVDAGHIYWTSQHGIGRANLDGTAPKNMFISTKHAWAVAVSSTHVYWTNDGGRITRPGTIGRANLDGTKPNARFITGASSPRGLAVDSHHVYWSNYSGTVGRATLNGGHVSQTFIRRAGGFGMAVDAEGPAP
jgi:virginiamycin B lyase